jgi:FkbM family methyltransferase
MRTLFYIIPKLAYTLSEKKIFSPVLTLKLWYFCFSRKLNLTQKDMPVSFWYNNLTFTLWLHRPMDLAVLREIYLDKEYNWCPVEDPKVIIDLGAHYGDTSLYYHARFPKAQIIAVEPAPESFERLLKNTKNIPEIRTIQAAVGATDGMIDLYLGQSPLGHSVIEGSQKNNSISVPQVTLHTLVQKANVTLADLVKFDIEGAEFLVFGSLNATKLSTAYIGEVHEDLSGRSINEFSNLFSGRTVVTERLSNKQRFIVKIS